MRRTKEAAEAAKADAIEEAPVSPPPTVSPAPVSPPAKEKEEPVAKEKKEPSVKVRYYSLTIHTFVILMYLSLKI